MPAVLRSRGDGAAGRHLEIPPVCSHTHHEEQEGRAAYSALLTFDFQAAFLPSLQEEAWKYVVIVF